MIKIIIPLTRWLINSLNSVVSWLEHINRSTGTKSKFVDLAPTDEADKTGVYSEAILFATSNAKVSNIALTGPYGSGKSSIIQSFLKMYRRPALHVSLAAFVPEAESASPKVSRQEIEISILQQMLYGADANKLPLSRFRRIQSPGVGAIFKSLYIVLGILALSYLFHQRENIISGTFFLPLSLSNWLNLVSFMLAGTFLWVTVHHFYVASFGLSLKSISLKDIEIKPAYDDQASILNRHLDEIIYFFQSTDYDLVIIEDLDRFNDAEIFVTLREINSLVNENAGLKQTIRFLYALRDDMFINTDRTKFFEFIIPVIPIINTSNSIDMVLEQGKRLELDKRLDRQFLREVSRYLNDLRLIQNIFNEYAIYVANLETDGDSLLDANKLLAVLIYKNVYPRDFEQLHRGAGILAKILRRQEELIADGTILYRTEIAELEERLEVAERQTPLNLKELRQIYAMALIEELPQDVHRLKIDQQTWITLPELASHDAFEQLIQSNGLYYRNIHNQASQVNISKLQSKVDPQKSYQQRKDEIETKGTDSKKKSLHKIRDLRLNISALRTAKLKELLRLNTNHSHDLFVEFGQSGELARFLILEGHLDDTYYQYTSLFHSGRLSPNDNKFLIQIRAYLTPEPGFPIDNPKEVIAAMRNEDFRQSYVLNVKLVDSLLSDRHSYREQTRKLFEFLSREFASCEGFFEVYYTSGHDVVGLLSGLANAWKGLVEAAIASPNNISHITKLVSHMPESMLEMLARNFELSDFVAENLPEILVNSPELAPERLICLDFKVIDMEAIKDHAEIVHAMFEKGLYKLTISNLEFVYKTILGEIDLEPLRERNFTTIRSANNPTLIKRVEIDFNRYLREVLLELQENSKEDAAAILDVIQHDSLDEDDLREFLERQTNLLPTLEGVPEKFHAMLFKLNLIEPVWSNCLHFMEGEGYEAESLVGYLDRDDVRAAILESPIPNDSGSLKLRQLLAGAGSLSDAAYREYANALPNSFKQPPEGLKPAKLRILIDERKITFTEESLQALADERDLQVLLVATHIEKYLNDPDKFTIDDDFREELLRSEIDINAKIRIVELIDLGALLNLPQRAAVVGPIIQNADIENLDLNAEIIRCLIENTNPVEAKISLLNKCNLILSNSEVRQILATLPMPYSEIKTGYFYPRLKSNAKNLELVRWLDKRNIISSWSEGKLLSNDIKINLYRR